MPCVAYHYRMISHMPLKESEVLAVPENNIQYRWISLQEVCDYLGVKRHTIMRWIEPVSYTHLDVYKRQGGLRS